MSARAKLLAALLATYALALGAPSARADAGLEADAGPPADGAPKHSGLDATLKTELAPASIAVGEIAKLTLEVDAPPGTELALPEQPVGSLELVDRSITSEEHDGRSRGRITLSLLALAPGEAQIPALSVRAVSPTGEYEELRSEPRTLEVSSLIANEPNAEPKPATGPVVVVQDDYTLAWVALGLLGAALVAAGTLYVSRWLKQRPKAPVPPPPPRPPWEIALEELDALARQKSQLLAEERGEVFVDAVSDTVRVYLGRRYGFDGLERTTAEVLSMLEQLRPEKLSLSGVSLLLEQCDLVKFARATPDEEQCDDLFNGALGLVRATTPEPVLKVEEPRRSPSEEART